MKKTYIYDTGKELNVNSVILCRILKDERAAMALAGFRFLFGAGEATSHKRYCPAVENDCREMVRLARDLQRKIAFYPNLNRELTVELV